MYDKPIIVTRTFGAAVERGRHDAMTESHSVLPTIELSPLARRFVLHWGEMGSRWGVNRTVAQIHALLYFVGRPVNAEDLSSALDVARSNVSNSLRELQSWKLVRVVHRMDDRRDHFETSRDVWDLFRTIVAERKTREFDPTMAVLRECIADRAFTEEEPGAQQRIEETLALMESLSAWGEEMLGLDPATLVKVMKLGARIQMLIRGGKPGKDGKPRGVGKKSR
jgi:DNA-binding transcriptional regulator GbsR (MarR family)